ATLNWALNGPSNGRPTWWEPYNRAFAPRLGLAYAPSDRGGLIGKIFGKEGVFRAGAGIAYDRFGSDLMVQYDQFGAIGLATAGNPPDSYVSQTSPRYNGPAPPLPLPQKKISPYPPPDTGAIWGVFRAIPPNLNPPMSYLLNASFARKIPGKMTIEIGYAGR